MAAADDLSPSPTPSKTSAGGGRWAPHGRQLTGGVIALNIFLVLLVYFYFWRFFSRKFVGAAGRSGVADDEDEYDDSSAASPPAVSPKARDRQAMERAITALPVFVHSSGADVEDGGDSSNTVAVECAICIAEFADGEEGRLLPRCGHRFHARCVDMWFQFHSTCPLCRAGVLPPPLAEHATVTVNTNADTDCPV